MIVCQQCTAKVTTCQLVNSFYIDSLIVADSKFAEEHVYLEKEIVIDLDNILSHYMFENDVDTLSLRAMICYEGNTQKEEVLKLVVKRNGTSVLPSQPTTTAHRSTTTSTDSASPHPPTNASSILRGETERRR